MGLKSTPLSERIHIGFFGFRNAGKSSLVNAVCNQELSIVSDMAGTTTDPVYKSMELLPLGPVVIIDTAGIDDDGELGEKRVEKTMQVIAKTDIAILVSDAARGLTDDENKLIDIFKQKNIPYIIAFNKCDLIGEFHTINKNEVYTSAKEGIHIDTLRDMIAKLNPEKSEKTIFGSLISKGDVVVLITPIDESAPKGRLILPQVQSIRDILDKDAICVVTKETSYAQTLELLEGKVKLAVCDSQVFAMVNKLTPENIPLTSFSILMARLKGYLESAYDGIKTLDSLLDGDKILISEGCTHHRQCNDIGTVKLPMLIKKYTGKNVEFCFTQGGEFPKELKKYKLIIHCGGCMLTEREVQSRMSFAKSQGIPFSNYGIAIAYMNGIIKRSTKIFEELN